jgi:hypothetical protein
MTQTVKTLDFLPDRYRQATTRRRNSYWRLVVTLLFVGAFAATAVGLHSVHRDVRAHAANVDARLASARLRLAAIKQKSAELATLDEHAALVTFLRHPWPRSRLAASVLADLPATITVEKMRIYAVDRPKPPQSEASATGETAAPVGSAVAGDLEELKTQVEAYDVVVQVDGVTRDLPGLHLYLQSLLANELFVKAEPTSIEAVSEVGDRAGNAPSPGSGVARFTAHVTVVPGWGCPGGPAADEGRGAAGMAAAPSDPPASGSAKPATPAVKVLAGRTRRGSP